MHPEELLLSALGYISPTKITGPFFRAVIEENAGSPQTFDGTHSRKKGGRYNPAGSFNTIYLSTDNETAKAEVGAIFQSSTGFFKYPMNLSWVIFTIDGALQVLDLINDPQVLTDLGTSYQELTGAWRSYIKPNLAPTQILGAAVFHYEKFQGILYPSSKNTPNGKCLAIFQDRLKKGDFEHDGFRRQDEHTSRVTRRILL